jgi:hypothetical protein
MRQPEGYVVKGKEDLVCRLKRTLYGLKQSAREWNKTLHASLLSMGFTQSAVDHCLYSRHDGNGLEALIGVWVDDCLIAGKNRDTVDRIKAAIAQSFKVTDGGPVNFFVGAKIERNRERKTLFMSQSAYIDKMLDDFNMKHANTVSTPQDPHVRLCADMCPKTPDDVAFMKDKPYRSLVGALLFASLTTRPDIATAVGEVSRFMSNPGATHWTAAKRILRYLKGTRDYGIEFNGADVSLSYRDDGKLHLDDCIKVFADADYAGDLDTRRSTSGYVLFAFGGPLAWRSKRQKHVTSSTMEAEYVSLFTGTQENEATIMLLQSIGIEPKLPTEMYEDNQSAIALTKDCRHQSRAKHIDIKYHFTREKLANGRIVMVYCPTKDMIADILTKPITRAQFEELRHLLGVRERKKV